MEISLDLKESMYDCEIQITDTHGSRSYYISASGDDIPAHPVRAEIFDNECMIRLVPVMQNTKAVLSDFEVNTWKDKLAKKTSKMLLDAVDKTILRVGCDYKLVDLQDGDLLDINLQIYTFGTFDRFDLLGLFPVSYMFFEISKSNKFFKLAEAYGTNRKSVLKYVRSLSLTGILEYGILTIFTYPVQVHRVKRLTRNKKILKHLTKFNTFSNAERQRFLDKQFKYL